MTKLKIQQHLNRWVKLKSEEVDAIVEQLNRLDPEQFYSRSGAALKRDLMACQLAAQHRRQYAGCVLYLVDRGIIHPAMLKTRRSLFEIKEETLERALNDLQKIANAY